jgi:hypothetical protein
MAQNAYIGVGNKARNVSKMYIGAQNSRVYNLIKNGTLSQTSACWVMDNGTVATQNAGYITVRFTTTSTSGTKPNYQLFTRQISGSTQEANRILFAAAMVRGRTTNVHYPRVYLRGYRNGSSEASFYSLQVDTSSGDSSDKINDGNWHLVFIKVNTYGGGNNYTVYDRIAFGTNTTVEGDEIDICNIFVCDLTETFGTGHEPTSSWCLQNLYYPSYSIIYNGSLNSDYHGWTLSGGTATNIDNSIMLTPSSNGSRPEIRQEFEAIEPGNLDEKVFMCVEVKGSQSNTSYPVFAVYPVSGNGMYQPYSFDGKSKMELNDGDWHPLNLYMTIGQNNTYKTLKTIVLCSTFESGYSTSTTDSYYFKNARVYNLTKIFGSGKEPTEEWCKEHLVYGGYKDSNAIQTYFTNSIAPTNWVLYSNDYRAKAGNAYGEWEIIGDNKPNSGAPYLINSGFDDDSSTYFATGSYVGHERYTYMKAPVDICPTSIYVQYYYVSGDSTIQGYNYYTNQWEDLCQLDYTASTKVGNTYTISTTKYYSYFRMNMFWSSSSGSNSARLYEFKINSGYVDTFSVNYLNIPKTDMKTVAKKVTKAYIGVNGVAEQCYPSNKNYNGLSFYRHATSTMSEARNSYGHVASAGQYALIMGGENSSSLGYTNTVEAYNNNMIKSSLSSLTYVRKNTSSNSFNNCAIICGGYGKLAGSSDSATYLNTYEYYNNNLSHSVGTIDYTVNRNAMANNKDFCLIAGGYGTLAPTLRPRCFSVKQRHGKNGR